MFSFLLLLVCAVAARPHKAAKKHATVPTTTTTTKSHRHAKTSPPASTEALVPPPATAPLDADIVALREAAARLPRGGAGPYCLGAVGTLALQGSFKTHSAPLGGSPGGSAGGSAPETPGDRGGAERHLDLAPILLLAAAPQSGSSWLAAAFERGAHYQAVATTHYPFFEADDEALVKYADGASSLHAVVLLVRNVFDAHRAYVRDFAQLVKSQHRKRAAYYVPLTLDAFAHRWAAHNAYWMRSTHHAFIVHYEQLRGDPQAALLGAAALPVDLALAHISPALLTAPPPRLVEHGACEHALDALNATTVRRIVTLARTAELGYSLVQAAHPWPLVVGGAQQPPAVVTANEQKRSV